MGRSKNDLVTLARAARAQLLRAQALGKSLDVRMESKREAAEGWTPDDSWRADFGNVTTAIVQCGNSLAKALEGRKKDLAGATTEQLEAQLKAELARMSDEEWAALTAARGKKSK